MCFGWFTQIILSVFVDSTRIVQTVEDMERKWSSCFAVGKSQVWMDIKEEYGIRPKGKRFAWRQCFGYFWRNKSTKAAPA